MVDSKFTQQIKDTDNKQVKPNISNDPKIQFTTSEVEMTLKSINIYVDGLIEKICTKFQRQ